MINKSMTKEKMPEQAPEIRNKNFLEVTYGYTQEQAQSEAKRCLHCKDKPCTNGCPVNVQIPEFIGLVAEGLFEEAYQTITQTNNLPAVCGRVCPQELQCEAKCVRGKKGEPVAIGRLERFVADWHMVNEKASGHPIDKNNKKIAIVGSGPASLACAGDLAKKGYTVTVFEAFHTPGGVLVYGIPEFRLPKKIVKYEIENLKELGVEIKTNMVIGKVLSLEDLKEQGYEAIFVGSGAGLPRFMNIPGENLNGVSSANEFLTRMNLMKSYQFPLVDTPVRVVKNAAIVGGGNVAMDAARSAKRLGVENVYIIYRRSEEEIPARAEEVHHAMEEGIIFKFLTNPTRIIGTEDGWVKGIECEEMELGEPDSTGRRKPIVKKDSAFTIEVDSVVMAIGTSPNPLIKNSTPDLLTTNWGGIIADDETGKTSKDGVYAGGDAVTGAATVILAMGAGKKAAIAIDEYIKNK